MTYLGCLFPKKWTKSNFQNDIIASPSASLTASRRQSRFKPLHISAILCLYIKSCLELSFLERFDLDNPLQASQQYHLPLGTDFQSISNFELSSSFIFYILPTY